MDTFKLLYYKLKCSLSPFLSNKKVSVLSYTPIIAEQGADEVDHHIVELCEEGDLVITADIPLADHIISKDAHAIDHKGELYSIDNIKAVPSHEKPHGEHQRERRSKSLWTKRCPCFCKPVECIFGEILPIEFLSYFSLYFTI